MKNKEAILILQDELNHVKSHLQYIGKAPEYYEEMSNLAEALDIGIRAIDNAPTVELAINLQSTCNNLQQRQGEWIRKVDVVGFVSYVCSECGAEIELEDCSDNKFCFNCGAEMQKGEEGEQKAEEE